MPEHPYRSLQEIEGRLESIRSELRTIDGLQDPTENDLLMQGTLIAEHDRLEEDAKPIRQRMADLERIRRNSGDPENREEAASSGTESVVRSGQAPEMFMRSGIDKDPLADLDLSRVESGFVRAEELRHRSAALIELDEKRKEINHDFAEIAYARSQGVGIGTSNGGIAKHILLTGSQSYRDAFRSYMEDPLGTEAGTLLSMGENGRYRAVNLTNASGGYLLPYVLDPTIILTNNASANPFRRVSRIVQTTSNAWQGVNSAGVTAAWIAEATTASDMSPTVGQVQIVPQKAVAWVLGSYEALDDTNFGEQLPGLLSDARDRLESAAFATGAGTASGLPQGIISALGTGSRVAPAATGTAFNGTASNVDVYNLQAALPPRFRNSPAAAFLGNIKILNAVRAIDQYGGGSFWTNFTSNTPAGLLGQSIYEASDLPSGTTGTSAASGTGSATLLFGDFSQFVVADRVGVSMLYEPMIKGSGNAQLPSGQAGWYMFWRTGSQVSTTAAFRYLTIS
jgi:HK97 family phage major capsid protein